MFGASHIRELVEGYVSFPDNVEIYHVPFGVDMDKWTYRERSGGKNIAFIAHRWSAKGLPLLAQVMMRLRGYKLHILGNKSSEKWLHAYWDYIVDQVGFPVEETEHTDSVNEWLDDKDYLIVTSQKEAFSYVAAEAAAKAAKDAILGKR